MWITIFNRQTRELNNTSEVLSKHDRHKSRVLNLNWRDQVEVTLIQTVRESERKYEVSVRWIRLEDSRICQRTKKTLIKSLIVSPLIIGIDYAVTRAGRWQNR